MIHKSAVCCGLPLLLAVVLGWPGPAVAQVTPRITGLISPTKGLTGVAAIERKTRKKVVGKIVDAKTGRFAVAGLTAGRVYDLQVDFGQRCRLEGINLKVPRSDYVEEQPLAAEDIKVINTKVRRLNKFEDEVQILTIQGNIQHAAILITKLRTRPFFGSKPGELIWRAELWHFERPEETWLKRTDELFTVLYRERMQKSRYVQKSVTFDGSLGGIAVTSKNPRVELGRIAAPSTKPGVRLRGAGSAVDKKDKKKDAEGARGAKTP